jgi:hypothetical protein
VKVIIIAVTWPEINEMIYSASLVICIHSTVNRELTDDFTNTNEMT